MSGVDNVERFMKRMAAAEAGAPVPSASAVWWRAELRRRMALEERATRPMRIADGVACTLCTVAAAWLAVQLGAFGVLQVFVR
jgi:hypothetical protein